MSATEPETEVTPERWQEIVDEIAEKAAATVRAMFEEPTPEEQEGREAS